VAVSSRLTHKSCIDRFSALEADILLLREKCSHEIQDIAEKLSEKEDTIKKQGDEISKLKACNRKLQQNMNKLNDKLNQQESSDNDKSHCHNNKALYSEKPAVNHLLFKQIRTIQTMLI
jgi:predicted RNase H-like nuclease (RuvC/YqgF family)